MTGSPARPEKLLSARAIVIRPDGTVWRVRVDGSADELLPPGYPRPGCAHAVATRRRP